MFFYIINFFPIFLIIWLDRGPTLVLLHCLRQASKKLIRHWLQRDLQYINKMLEWLNGSNLFDTSDSRLQAQSISSGLIVSDKWYKSSCTFCLCFPPISGKRIERNITRTTTIVCCQFFKVAMIEPYRFWCGIRTDKWKHNRHWMHSSQTS